MEQNSPLKIGIVGAGFSGVAMAAHLARFAAAPVAVQLFEKSGTFARGAAYNTPYSFHLLNVRAQEMSLFDDQPSHFVDWLRMQGEEFDNSQISNRFVSRLLYGKYLHSALHDIQHDKSKDFRLGLVQAEVSDITLSEGQVQLLTDEGGAFQVDKVILALGNPAPSRFPFEVAPGVSCIHDPWEFRAPEKISRHETVVILGSGLSMIDVVLTLFHQGHEAPIYAISRHGLLPLTHAINKTEDIFLPRDLPTTLRKLTKKLREMVTQKESSLHDWRSLMNVLRRHAPDLWGSLELTDKKQFMRHLLPYWNIHRHRVPVQVDEILKSLMEKKQLQVLPGRILSADDNYLHVKIRGTDEIRRFAFDWLINCTGPSLASQPKSQTLTHNLISRGLATQDPLRLGFVTAPCGGMIDSEGRASDQIYTLGPPARGMMWECGSVPEIRKIAKNMAMNLLESSRI